MLLMLTRYYLSSYAHGDGSCISMEMVIIDSHGVNLASRRNICVKYVFTVTKEFFKNPLKNYTNLKFSIHEDSILFQWRVSFILFKAPFFLWNTSVATFSVILNNSTLVK